MRAFHTYMYVYVTSRTRDQGREGERGAAAATVTIEERCSTDRDRPSLIDRLSLQLSSRDVPCGSSGSLVPATLPVLSPDSHLYPPSSTVDLQLQQVMLHMNARVDKTSDVLDVRRDESRRRRKPLFPSSSVYPSYSAAAAAVVLSFFLCLISDELHQEKGRKEGRKEEKRSRHFRLLLPPHHSC